MLITSSVQLSHQFVSDTDPIDCSTPGFLVHHQLLEFTADGDCSHEIKRHLLLGRKTVTKLDQTHVH